MPSMNEINEAVFRGRFDDQMSKGAEAARKKMSELGDTVSQVDERVKKSEKTFEQMARRYDETARQAAAIAKATKDYESVVRAATAAVETGAKSQAQADDLIRRAALLRDAAIAKANSTFQQQRALYAQLEQASLSAAKAYDRFGESASKAAKFQAELNQFLGVDRSTQDYAARAADIDAYGRALDELRARITPLYAAELQFKDAVLQTERALKVGAITRNEATMANERYRASLEATARAATAASQNSFNQLAGITLPDAGKSASRAEDIQAMGREIDNLRSKYVPLEAELIRYREQLAEVRKAEKAGVLSALEAGQARTRIQNTYDAAVKGASAVEASHQRMGRQLNLTSQQLVQLSYQLNDVIAQSAVNTSPFIIAAQQGPQVVQALGGVTGAWRALTVVMSGWVGVAAAAAAAFLAPLAVVNAVESRLSDFRNSLRAFRDDYASTAAYLEQETRRIALGSPGFSLGDVSDASVTIERSRALSQITTPLSDLIALSRELSRTLDKDLASASTRVAAAMRDPANAAKELSEQGFPGVTEALRRQIEVLQRAGDRQQAFNLLFGAMRNQLQGADRDVSPLSAAIDRFTKAISELWEAIRPGIEGVGRLFLDWLTVMSRTLSGVVGYMGQFVEQVTTLSTRRNTGTTGAAWDGGATTLQDAIARVETGGQRDPWGTTNQFNFAGRYQFGVAALHDTGIYQMGPSDRDRRGNPVNAWSGTWNYPGVNSLQDFLANPGAQNEAFTRYIAQLNRIIDSNNLLSGNPSVQGIPVTRDALLGVGWGRPQNMIDLVQGRAGAADGNGLTAVERFMMFSRNVNQGGAVPVRIDGVSPQALGPTAPATSPQLAVDEAVRRARGYSAQQGSSTRETATADVRAFSEARDRLEQQNAALREQRDALDSSTEEWRRLNDQMTVNSSSIQVLNNGIDGARAALRGTLNPIEEMLRGWENSADAARDAGSANAFVRDRLRELDEASMRYRGTIATQEERTRATTLALGELSAQYRNTADQLTRQIGATQRIAAATSQSAAAGQRAEAVERAREEVRKTSLAGTSAEAAAIENLARKYLQLASAEAERATAQRTISAQNELQTLQAEYQLIGQTAEARERELNVLRERQRILQADPNADLNSPINRQALDAAARLGEARAQLEQFRDSFNFLANFFDQTFERIGSAITEAFAKGEISTIKWGNVAKAILSQVIQAAITLAVINPMMNWAFGYSRPTLGSVGGAVGSMFGGSPGGGGGGLFSMGNLSTLGSAGKSAYQLANGSTGVGFIDNWLSAPVWSPQNGWFATGLGGGLIEGGSVAAPSIAGLSSAEAFASLPAVPTAATTGLGGASIGGVLAGGAAGVGLGFAAGTLISQMLAKTEAQRTNGMIGSGVGALGSAAAGAAIGSVVPVIGTALGALIGGIVGGAGGGALGGIIGPSRQFSGGDVGIGINPDGTFRVSGSGGKRWNQRQAVEGVQEQLNGLNDFMRKAGLRVEGAPLRGEWGGSAQIWGFGGSGNKAGDIESLFSAMIPYLQSNNANVNTALRSGRLTGLQNTADAIDWITSVYEPMSKAAEQTSKWKEQIDAINQSYWEAGGRAQYYGLSIDAMTKKWQEASAEFWKQYNYAVRGVGLGLTNRGINAELAVETDPTKLAELRRRQRDIALEQFDYEAEKQKKELKAQLEDLYLNVWNPGEYQRLLMQEDEVLAKERLALWKQYEDQINQAKDAAEAKVIDLLTGLADYAAGLRSGDMSPLSPMARLEAAQSQWQETLTAGLGGDYSSLTKLTGYSDNYLKLARDVYGGGIGYADAFNQVVAGLDQAGNVDTELLTASAMADIAQDQTETLVEELTRLREEVAKLSLEIRQGNTAPASAQ